MTKTGFAQLPLDLIRYVRSCKLTAAQYNLWLYIVEIDPFGDRWYQIPSPEVIAHELGLSLRTIERAAQRLKDLKLVDFQITSWFWHNKAKDLDLTQSTNSDTNQSSNQHNFSVSSTKMSEFRHSDTNVENETKMSNSRQKSPDLPQECQKREPKPAPDKASETAHTIQTYSDFTDSLSLEEKESFLEFGEKMAQSLPKPPQLIYKWIESNWQDIRRNWEKTPARAAKSAKTINWEAHPNFKAWIAKIREIGPFMFCQLGKEEEAFATYCDKNKKYYEWGIWDEE